MSQSLHAQTTPKPKPTKATGTKGTSKDTKDKQDKKADTNKTEKTDDTTTSTGSDGNLAHSAGTWLAGHPIAIPILLVALIVGINIGWAKFRNWRISKGMPTRGLGAILKDQIRFAIKEDKRPLHAKTPWLTGTRLYLLLLLLTILSALVTIGIPFPVPAFLLLVTFASRYSKIAKARYGIVRQMFDVANGEIRYPKGAELNPWRFVNITNWTNLTQPGQTVVNMTAAYQSEDMKTRERFERNFNGTVSEENAWTYKWESVKNRIVCQPAAFLPQMAPYPGPGPKWDEIPVGVQGDGTQAIMPLSVSPHALVCGPTGSGKSVLQRMILFHVLAHSETWRIVAIDMKKVEMTWLRKYPSVLKVATDLEESVEVLRSLRAEMMRRYEEMEQQGVNHAKDLPDPPKAILCMIDETTVLLAAEGIKSDEGKERDELHAEAQMIIGELGRLSRASMIHVIMCFQRPDAKYLGGEIKANFDLRIAAGRMDTTPSLMVLDSEAANRLPKVKGRGMIRIGGELDTFQGYFAEQTWYDGWVAAQQDSPQETEPLDAPPTPIALGKAADDDERASGRRGGGLKGLAAKAAAKAEARAARLDVEEAKGAGSGTAGAGLSASSDPEGSVSEVVKPQGELDGLRRKHVGRVVTVADDEFVGDSEPDSAAVALDDFLVPPSFDGSDFDDDEDEIDEPPPVTEVAPVVPDRPVVPQPVAKPVAAYDPDSALPSWLTDSVAALDQEEVMEPASEPTPPDPVATAPRPAGLPMQPPAGLPIRPPTTPTS